MAGNDEPAAAASSPFGLNVDEWRLVRLFRCMKPEERHDLLHNAGLTLLVRVPLLDASERLAGCVEGETEFDLESDDRLMWLWPADWPGRKLLDLDAAGDAGAFIEQCFPDMTEALLGSSGSDEATAEGLTDAFYNWPCAQDEIEVFEGISLEDGCDADEVAQVLQSDFVRFLKEWRQQIIQAIEVNSHKAFRDALGGCGGATEETTSALDPELMRATARLVKAAINHGIATFHEFIAYVDEAIGAEATEKFSRYFESGWRVLKESNEYSHVDDAGTVSDVLETLKEQPMKGPTWESALAHLEEQWPDLLAELLESNELEAYLDERAVAAVTQMEKMRELHSHLMEEEIRELVWEATVAPQNPAYDALDFNNDLPPHVEEKLRAFKEKHL